MAMSDLSAKLRSFLHMAGVLGIIVGTQISLVGLWNFVIPVLIAAVILATSWVSWHRLPLELTTLHVLSDDNITKRFSLR